MTFIKLALLLGMLIGGAGLARGYWGRPELTAESFVPHPWPAVAGERVAPELVQEAFTAEALADVIPALLGGAGELQRRGLATVRERLGA